MSAGTAERGGEHREQLFAAAPLQRLVSAKLLGRKSGRGLYDYA